DPHGKLWGEKDDFDVWDELQFLSIDEPAIEEPSKIEPEDMATYNWKVTNKSPGGYGLSCQIDDDDLLSVGELLLLKSEELSSETSNEYDTGWQLGTICWMQAAEEGKSVNLGVYILARHVKKIHAVKLDGSHLESESCLLLDDITPDVTPSLLMSRSYAKTGDVLLVKSIGEPQKVHLDEAVWNSEGFAQYHFHLYNDQEEIKSLLLGL
ncbi:MAG: hypothetical protein OEY48_05495, partial [Gammaproteobacteria bacterium]|nr:hypothetical protein [Gammaproteobacteria bacterium]